MLNEIFNWIALNVIGQVLVELPILLTLKLTIIKPKKLNFFDLFSSPHSHPFLISFGLFDEIGTMLAQFPFFFVCLQRKVPKN